MSDETVLAPWEFRGVKGPIFSDPHLAVLAVEAVDIYEDDRNNPNRPPTVIGQGSKVTMRLHGDSVCLSLVVLDTPEMVVEQITLRDGWFVIQKPSAS
jgi:hypothetical protein